MNRWRLSPRPRLFPRKRSIPLRLERLEDRTVPSIDLLTTIPGTSVGATNSNAGPTNPAAVTGPAVAQTFHTATPLFGPGQSPGGYWPSQIRHAYGFDQLSLDGTGQTIAIVDAYGDPNLAKDLAAFDTQFNLAAPPSFRQVSQTGGADSTVPTDPTGGWEVEEALDVEWAHAIAPKANILLVEANSANLNDLLNAVSYATKQSSVNVVSMSWGGGEFSGQSNYDSYFTTPAGHKGITFVAASGDNGTPAGWPASSPNVLAVGGTSLNLDASDNRTGEPGWSSSGGGLSAVYGTPSYQQTYAQSSYVQNTLNNRVLLGGSRGNPDVSYNADSSPGYAVYDTFAYNGTSHTWWTVGGTSAGSPQWAALVALADQQRGSSGSLDGPGQTLPELYKLAANATSYPRDFFDVTSGSNGDSAQAGYDLVSGLGSPNANNLILDLAGTGSSSTTPTVTASSPSGTVNGPVSSVTFTFNEGMNPNSFALSDITSFTGPGGVALAAPTGYSWLDNNTELQVNFASQSAAGSYSMVLGTNVSDPNGNTLSQSYTANFAIAAAGINPTVLSSSPSGTVNGPIGAVTFTFSEAMNPASFSLGDITSFTGPGGNPVLPTGYTWSPNDTQLQVLFLPQSAAGSYSMVLGSNISDPNGNQLAGSYTASFIIAPTVTPVVVSSTPSGTVSGPVGSVTFTFNEAMNPASFALSDVQSFLGPNGSLLSQVTGYSWSPNDTQLQVNFTPQTTAGLYGMMLGTNIRDNFGNSLTQSYTATYTIQAPSVTPVVVSSSPSGTVNGPVNSVTFTFNEAMNAASFSLGDITSFTGPGGTPLLPATYTWSPNDTQLQVNFASQSAAGSYSMVLGPNISDPNGHMLSQAYTASFTIQAPSVTPTVLSSTPSGTVQGPVSSVTFTFNEGMNPNSFALNDVTSFTGPGGTALLPTGYSWLASNTELQVDFTPQSAAGSYSMVLGTNISDPNGTKLAQSYTATYTIAAPSVTPVIVSSTPSGTVSGPVSSVTFTFNEGMNPASFSLGDVQSFLGPNGNLLSQVTGYRWLANNTELQVNFTPQTTAGPYGMMLGPNIRDNSGNSLTQSYTATFALQGPSSTQTFSAQGMPAPLMSGFRTISPLNITPSLDLSKLTVQLNISYAYTGDLAIDLISPNGTDVRLSSFEGRGSNFQNTVFDDAAATAIHFGNAPFAGRYRPEAALAAVNGQNAVGTWYLEVQDWGPYAGSIKSWSLTVQGSSPLSVVNAPSGATLTPVLVPLVVAQPSANGFLSSATVFVAGTDTDPSAASVSTTSPATSGLDNGTGVMIVHALTAPTGTAVVVAGSTPSTGANGVAANVLLTGPLSSSGSATALSSGGQAGSDADDGAGGLILGEFDLPPMADPALASSAVPSAAPADTTAGAEATPAAAVCDAVFADEQGLAFLGDREARADGTAVSSGVEDGPSAAVVLVLALGGFWRGEVAEQQQPSEERRRGRV